MVIFRVIRRNENMILVSYSVLVVILYPMKRILMEINQDITYRISAAYDLFRKEI